MISAQYILPLAHELVVDLFAGGGGASTGIEQAIGRHVDIAVNHDRQAVSLHQANHPQTRHFLSDVFEVDPVVATRGQPVGLMWASPDCKHFSKAKGGKPVSKKIRGLAGVVIKWAKAVKPRVICLENVEEFQTWGPLTKGGMPCPNRKGQTFHRWVARLRDLGYAVQWRELRACDFGAPTIRKRLFMVARCDGAPIVWPEPTHGPGLKPYLTAADCIDWSIPAPSIFERQRPLAPATMRRIAHGLRRYVLENPSPYIVRIGQTGHGDGGKVHSARNPLSTVTSKNEHLLVQPLAAPVPVDSAHSDMAPNGAKRWSYGNRQATNPLPTVVASGGSSALAVAFLAKHFGGKPQPGKTAQPIDAPAPTILAQGGPQALVTSHMVKLHGASNSTNADRPLHTISTQGQHRAEVYAFLTAYYGSDQDTPLTDPLHTITTKHRFGLVTVAGALYEITDIGMRMLQPRELYRAQGFPDSYIIDRGADGGPLPKDAQVRMCGNSVCPPLARAIVASNYREVRPISANESAVYWGAA